MAFVVQLVKSVRGVIWERRRAANRLRRVEDVARAIKYLRAHRTHGCNSECDNEQRAHSPNYNSTKVCFAYFVLCSRRTQRKAKPLLLLVMARPTSTSPNCPNE